ncbi:hypothetical protein AVEN_62713-1 [Araneus ventricosus]|uniref:Uncharacterized protein n=1 Tax=Araneus ventricosus TaxID=182803 RepID=A0A4Y2KYK8_ARAVE|nr:hypothetical protein AVEN_62713-1 [Araneus ventricosus]
MCFLCYLSRRKDTRHFLVLFMNGTAETENNITLRKNGQSGRQFDPGAKVNQRENLVDPKKVLLPPLHIRLGLMKQFVKALPKEGECFE